MLSGHGEMVADGGMDGLEGRHPAKAGDAYFFRLNCTVGFYAEQGWNEKAEFWQCGRAFPSANSEASVLSRVILDK